MDQKGIDLPDWANLSSPDLALETLDKARVRIDAIDVSITRLLNERAHVVEVIGEAKQRLTMKVYEPKREQEVMANIAQNNDGPLSNEALSRVYERVMDEMRTLQRDRMRGKEESGT
ncbi:MAG: chorismate mutase [Acidobacteriota bacterium]